MDGGAWWAAVHGVATSRTRLSDFPFTFHFHPLENEMATHSSVLSWRIPGTGKPGGLPSVGSHRVGHDWSDLAAAGEDENKTRFWFQPWCIWGTGTNWDKEEVGTSLRAKHTVVLSRWKKVPRKDQHPAFPFNHQLINHGFICLSLEDAISLGLSANAWREIWILKHWTLRGTE